MQSLARSVFEGRPKRAAKRVAVHAAIAICLFGLGRSTWSADLFNIYQQGLAGDPTYAAARATWAAAQEGIPQARAALLPLASLSASAQYNKDTTRDRSGPLAARDDNFGSRGLTLSITQPIYRKQSAVAYDQALTRAEQADVVLHSAAQDLILRVAQGYFDVLFAEDAVAFAEAQKRAIGQQLEQSKRNFQVGTATIADTHEAQARYDLTTAQEIAARNDLELRRHALEQFTGRSAPPLSPLASKFTRYSPEPAHMQTWVDRALNGNLQVRARLSELTFATQEIARNRAGHHPTLDLFATATDSSSGSTAFGATQTPRRTAAVGVQLTVPLYQGGAISSQVREAISLEDRARYDLESARRSAELSARQAFLGTTSGIAQVQALEAALLSMESQLSSTQLAQVVGVRTQLDVLNAQQLLFSARRDLAQSKYSYVLSVLRLAAAVGELTQDRLVMVNQWLDQEPTKEPSTKPLSD